MKLDHYLSQAPQQFRNINIPVEVIDEAKKRLIDSWGCFSQGYEEAPVVRLRQAFLTLTKGPCLVWGSHRRVSPEVAVILNGATVRALDFNDTYLSLEPCHPSDLLAAFWAACEVSNSRQQGKLLLRAMILGYEVLCRLCDGASLRKNGWDHVTYLPIASAVGCAYILGLTLQQTRHAIALAITPNNALRQTRVGEISDWKAACAAYAARAGFFAALAAKAGVSGPDDIFSGRHGFIQQVSHVMNYSHTPLGSRWKISQTHIKRYPAEHHAQSAIEAAIALHLRLVPLSLRSRRNMAFMIKEIVITTFDVAADIIGSEKEKWQPRTRETADHSIAYLVAVALIEGVVNLEQYRQRRFLDNDVIQLMKRVRVKRSQYYSTLYPRQLPSSVTITLHDGHVYRNEVLCPLGYASRPMSFIQVHDKFNRLSSSCRSITKQKQVVKMVASMEQIKRISVFERALSIRHSHDK